VKYYSRFKIADQYIWSEYVDGAYFPLIGSIHDQIPKISSTAIDMENAILTTPYFGQKVMALAYNYKSLIGDQETFDEPLVFFKSPSGVVPHGGEIKYPNFSDNVWIEAELTIVIGKEASHVSIDQADDFILGYTCGNDVTAENILQRDWHLARAKGLDTFCPLGPYLVKGIDTADLKIESFINGRQTQSSRTSDRVLNDRESVALASTYFTLKPGDVILTGTPAGATDAVVKPGDRVDIRIEHIGTLTNHVR
jgi:2-keto-4-pentenoate hydratase/2-oxohepta-3-ene-1,7-dioic acid hydratase in catechol pathway